MKRSTRPSAARQPAARAAGEKKAPAPPIERNAKEPRAIKLAPPPRTNKIPTPPESPSGAKANPFKSRSDRSSKFFFSDAAELFGGDGGSPDVDAGSSILPPLPSSSAAPCHLPMPFLAAGQLAPLLDDEDGAGAPPFSELDDDLLLKILRACPASTLREVKAVDQRTHRMARDLLRQPGRFHRAFTGAGRRRAHRELPARWAAPALACPDAVRLSADRLCIRRVPSSRGWATSIVDRWHSKEVLTAAFVIEELAGPACIGIVGFNYKMDLLHEHEAGGGEPAADERAAAAASAASACGSFGAAVSAATAAAMGDGDAPLERSRHAIVCDARSGRLFFKGHRSPYLALPLPLDRARRRLGAPRPAGAAGPLLRGGCRLNVVVDACARTLRLELLSQHGDVLTPESELEVECIPHEVAVAVSLGPTPSGGESRVRLVGMCVDAADSHDHGKTIKDLWDDHHVIKPLGMRELETPRGGAGGPSVFSQDAMAAEFQRVIASTAGNTSTGWGAGW